MATVLDQPTIRSAVSFDAGSDAANLKKAMKGLGTDEKLIIQVLGRRTSHQRQQIVQHFKKLYGKDLIAGLKSELGGQFEVVILALMTPLNTYLAQELNKAMKGVGTNEKTLIEVLCTRDNRSLREIKAAYQTQFGKSLETDLKAETSGDFAKFILSLANAARDETNTSDRSLAHSLAQSLFKAGEKKKYGTDESEFTRIVTSYSFPLLKIVFEEYQKISGHSFDQAIKSELSGDYRDGILSIYTCITSKAVFFATLLNDSMKGIGTREDALMRIIISRCEIDMGNIKAEYNKLYGKRLDDAVSSETSGDFKKILLALIQD